MGLLSKLSSFGRRAKGSSNKKTGTKKPEFRICKFEELEQRRVLSADPVIAGITYLEGDLGQDSSPDYFEVSFEGGSATTQLTQFTINGDQDLSGTITDGDMFFDVNSSQPGTGGHSEFAFDSANSSGVSASDIRSFNVSSDGLLLTVEIDNFVAGDVFAFTIDVDEVERLRVDKIASGVEFEGSYFNAVFADQHYTFTSKNIDLNTTLEDGFVQPQHEGVFYDEYDALFNQGAALTGSQLDLNYDGDLGQSDRTAGGIDAYDLTAKPVTFSGRVYHDENLNCELDSDESGIEGVTINLERMDANGNYVSVATTQTDANGRYEFGADLAITPGVFRLVEIQPDGYIDVGATEGKVEGVSSGNVQADAGGDKNIIAQISVPLGGNSATNYDFKEVLPASLQGRVWHDSNNDGVIDPGENGIANVMIKVSRVGAKSGGATDPFASFDPIVIQTDAQGFYRVDALPPGLYEVVEINNYPDGNDPLAGYVDGKDALGTVGGVAVGTKANDKFSSVALCADDEGINFNFGELRPATVSGYVSISTPEGDCVSPTDSNHQGLAGVTIELYGEDGRLVDSVKTNANGFYEFGDLMPGTYTVIEVQPDGYLDGGESLGEVDGQSTGRALFNDGFTLISLSSGSQGSMYNFCEHIPAELRGTVYHDANDNGTMESGEDAIKDVVVELYDASGNLVAQDRTDANGDYHFGGLYAGEYSIKEIQPSAFTDGKESLGEISDLNGNTGFVGTVGDDVFTAITVRGGDQGTNYDFGEIKLGSISGRVHADAQGDCMFDADDGDKPLAGVTLILTNSSGNEIGRTVTDSNGDYVFEGLRPGDYTVTQVQPDGYLNGSAMAGTVMGATVGQSSNNQLSGITLKSGQTGVNYDFCEHIPAELCGTVYHDANDNGVRDAGEAGIGNVVVQLYDKDGTMIAEQRTDSDGKYCFTELTAGQYQIRESQPSGYVDGKDSVGNINGSSNGQASVNDQFNLITIKGGEVGTDYNFGELKLTSIAGHVRTDIDGDCEFNAEKGERPMAGVVLELLNGNGEVISTTTTNDDGFYQFDNLVPGVYSVREQQPDNFFSAGMSAGHDESTMESGTGDTSVVNLISGIKIESGQNLVEYNFCENEAAEIHGRVWQDGEAFQTEDGVVPAGYRNLRDGIYQASEDRALAGVRMQLYYYIDPANVDPITGAGTISPRPVTIGEVLPGHYNHIGSGDMDAPVWVETSETGEYHFTGLKAGSYIVLEVQPDGYVDSNDTPGTTQGFSFNSFQESQLAPKAVLSTFSTTQVMDAVVNIQVASGASSLQNNFSEVTVVKASEPPVVNPPPKFTPPGNPLPPGAGITGHGGLAGSQPGFDVPGSVGHQVAFQNSGGGAAYTWHLSVVNGGSPRAVAEAVEIDASPYQQAGYLRQTDWTRFDMSHATWTFSETRGVGDIVETDRLIRFGMADGIPAAGDFDGDGIDELAVFFEGYWMIDINRNGQWDETDLLAKLGDVDDMPVVGDWDGDGKDDIGIYGPMWERDIEAIAREPGLPNPENYSATRPKNVPPMTEEATNGSRIMKLTSYGRQRADVVDHVFGTGNDRDIPVTGDWNGNGIRSIGMFSDGVWQLDINGDGHFTHEDESVNYGRAGDIPLVGDFNGDGIEEIAVYRSGTWLIDTDGNREMDATDKSFQMGDSHDIPVVGDWDGDGMDEPGLYHTSKMTNQHSE